MRKDYQKDIVGPRGGRSVSGSDDNRNSWYDTAVMTWELWSEHWPLSLFWNKRGVVIFVHYHRISLCPVSSGGVD